MYPKRPKVIVLEIVKTQSLFVKELITPAVCDSRAKTVYLILTTSISNHLTQIKERSYYFHLRGGGLQREREKTKLINSKVTLLFCLGFHR